MKLMKRMILRIALSTILIALPASGAIVRGTISDSTTGAPISNVKVLFYLSYGEITVFLDSSITGTTGSYSFPVPASSGVSLYIYTISNKYLFQSTEILGGIISVGIDDTITQDIKLKKIPTMVSATPNSKPLQSITFRTAKSRLYLSGMLADAVVELYALNGHRLFKTVVPAGASEVMIPERVAAAGSYQVLIRANGRPVCGTVKFR
jgi:hypothetical protein